MITIRGKRGFLGLIVVMAFFITACSDKDTAKQTGIANKEASKAVVSAVGQFTGGKGGGLGKPSLPDAERGGNPTIFELRKEFAERKAIYFQNQSGRQKINGASSDDFTGTRTVTTLPGGAIKTSFVDYTSPVENGRQTKSNGSMTVGPTSSGGFSTMFEDFEESTFLVVGTSLILTSYYKQNGSLIETVLSPTSTCTDTENSLFVLNQYTDESKEDNDADGTLDAHDRFTGDGLEFSSVDTVGQNCSYTGGTTTLKGKIVTEDLLDPTENMTIVFDAGFRIVDNVVSRGDTEVLTGTVTITSACVNGTFTITTPTPIFYPNSNSGEEVCPTAGVMVISGEGGTSTKITYNAGGSVSIDEGNDGSAEQTFPNCEALDVCSL